VSFKLRVQAKKVQTIELASFGPGFTVSDLDRITLRVANNFHF